MFLEVKNKFRKKAEKLYLWIFLCGNKQRLEEEKRMQQIEEENEILREEYMKIIENLKKLYDDNVVVLNASVIERCKYYLGDARYLSAIGCSRGEDLDDRTLKRHKRVHEGIDMNLRAQKKEGKVEIVPGMMNDPDDLAVENDFMGGRGGRDGLEQQDEEAINDALESQKLGPLSTHVASDGFAKMKAARSGAGLEGLGQSKAALDEEGPGGAGATRVDETVANLLGTTTMGQGEEDGTESEDDEESGEDELDSERLRQKDEK